jgi:hypothetical protein
MQCKNDKLYEVFCATFELYLAKYNQRLVLYTNDHLALPDLSGRGVERRIKWLLIGMVLLLIRSDWPYASH